MEAHDASCLDAAREKCSPTPTPLGSDDVERS
jgi:hypothetical protein